MGLRNWFCGLLLVACGALPGLAAPPLSPSSDSALVAPDPAFRSGLWRSLYAGQESVADVPGAAAESDFGASIQQHAQHLAQASTEAELGAFGGLPATVADFSDRGDSVRLPADRTAWHTAYIDGSGVSGATRSQTGGPSVTIVLVGFVALIVLGGSSLSGRG